MSNKQDVEDIFRDIFDDDTLNISESTTSDDIGAWDSVNHINLISAIEKHFKIRFALGELSGMKNVGEMLRLISEKTDL